MIDDKLGQNYREAREIVEDLMKIVLCVREREQDDERLLQQDIDELDRPLSENEEAEV